MTALLDDYQFELEDVPFGIDLPVHLAEDGFNPDMGGWRTQDFEHPTGDGGVPGRDFKEIGSWGFKLFTIAEDPVAALEDMAQLASVWPPEWLVETPLALVPLRYRLAGRTRRVYGRPRRWTAPPSNQLMNGYIPITCDFSVFNPLFYDDVEQTFDITIGQGTTGGGGLRSPLTAPMRTTGVSKPASRYLEVGGDRATWPVIELQGGINPWVEISGTEMRQGREVPFIWRCRALRSMNWDEKVTVDTRPWVRSSTINGGYARLSPDSRLAGMKLPPGRHFVRFGSDSAATPSTITVRWRDANSSL